MTAIPLCVTCESMCYYFVCVIVVIFHGALNYRNCHCTQTVYLSTTYIVMISHHRRNMAGHITLLSGVSGLLFDSIVLSALLLRCLVLLPSHVA